MACPVIIFIACLVLVACLVALMASVVADLVSLVTAAVRITLRIASPAAVAVIIAAVNYYWFWKTLNRGAINLEGGAEAPPQSALE